MKKYFYPLAFALLLAVTPTFAQSLSPQRYGPNLVQNASFEDGAQHWSIPKNSAKIVSGTSYTGGHSLNYANNDPQKYVLLSQEIEAKPGQRLSFSAKVRGENVDASQAKSIYASGAGIYVQSSEEDEFISGSYPPHYNGTFDWKEISASYTVPPNATKVSVGLYLRKGVVGAAWFDDVEVRIEEPPAYASFLQFPNYRGMVEQGDNSPWKLQVRAIPDSEPGDGKINIITTLTDSSEKVLLEDKAQITTSGNGNTIPLNPPPNLPAGKYTLVQRFVDSAGKALFTSEKTISVVKKMPRVYVDSDGFTVTDGQRFFPMGLYLSPTSDEDMQRAAEGGFNTILSYSFGDTKTYKTYLDRAAQHDLKVLYAINKLYPGLGKYGDEAYKRSSSLISDIRQEPALLGWYTSDELETSFIPKLRKGYNQITKLDPNHPAFQVHNKMDTLEQFMDTTDIIAPDSYPVGKKGSTDLTETSHRTGAVATAYGAKGVWVVPQIMDWAVYRKGWESHPPSLDEMRNQAYQALIHGAKGLIWYSYSDLKYKEAPRVKERADMELFARRWKDVTAMAQEINAFVPVILQNDTVSLELPQNAEIEAAAWKQGDKLALLLANPYYEAKSVTFALPQNWVIKEANQGQIKSTFADGKATFSLPSVGSGVFVLEHH